MTNFSEAVGNHLKFSLNPDNGVLEEDQQTIKMMVIMSDGHLTFDLQDFHSPEKRDIVINFYWLQTSRHRRT